MKTTFFHDKFGSSPITSFGRACNVVQNSISYLFKNLSLSKYLTARLLKKTELQLST